MKRNDGKPKQKPRKPVVPPGYISLQDLMDELGKYTSPSFRDDIKAGRLKAYRRSREDSNGVRHYFGPYYIAKKDAQDYKERFYALEPVPAST